MRDLLGDYERLTNAGKPVGRAVVTSVWGSAPRAEGASMLATSDGAMAGSVSGGCVEAATASEIGAAIERGTPKLVTFGMSDEQAWEVGLACGGTIKVFVEPSVGPELLSAARGGGGEVLATVVEGLGLGRSARVFEVFPRQPRLVIFGGVHIAIALDIGAIGSKKTQAARREWLRSEGFTDEEIARVHGPIGLDLGGRQPAETAPAILAQMTAVRYGGTAAQRSGRQRTRAGSDAAALRSHG